MKFIQLTQSCRVSRYTGAYETSAEQAYEPVDVNAEMIETISWAGLSYIRMASGERIEVLETRDQILAMIDEVSK